MNITKNRIKQIIQEELKSVIGEFLLEQDAQHKEGLEIYKAPNAYFRDAVDDTLNEGTPYKDGWHAPEDHQSQRLTTAEAEAKSATTQFWDCMASQGSRDSYSCVEDENTQSQIAGCIESACEAFKGRMIMALIERKNAYIKTKATAKPAEVQAVAPNIVKGELIDPKFLVAQDNITKDWSERGEITRKGQGHRRFMKMSLNWLTKKRGWTWNGQGDVANIDLFKVRNKRKCTQWATKTDEEWVAGSKATSAKDIERVKNNIKKSKEKNCKITSISLKRHTDKYSRWKQNKNQKDCLKRKGKWDSKNRKCVEATAAAPVVGRPAATAGRLKRKGLGTVEEQWAALTEPDRNKRMAAVYNSPKAFSVLPEKAKIVARANVKYRGLGPKWTAEARKAAGMPPIPGAPTGGPGGVGKEKNL